MSATLVATGINSGTGTVVTVTSTAPIPVGTLFFVHCMVGASGKTFTLSDNSGLGQSYTLTQLTDAVVGASGCLAFSVANANIPTGTVWTFTVSTGTPGGRMGAAWWHDDTLRSPFASDVDTSLAISGSSNPIISGTPTDAPELVVYAINMRSSTAGGAADSITLDGFLTQINNRNHSGTVTCYMASGWRKITNSNPINDSSTFQASDSSIAGYVTIKLPIPTPPSGSTPGERLILKLL